jgi:hypothetical protein
MSVTVHLPMGDHTRPISVDAEIAKDYVVDIGRSDINLVKYRPVKWYPMQVVMDFDQSIVPALETETVSPLNENEETVTAAVTASTNRRASPPAAGIITLAMAMLALGALILKARHVIAISRARGTPARFMILLRTGFAARTMLALIAMMASVAVQYAGYLAAGIPTAAAAAALLLFKRNTSPLKPKPDGVWRRMGDDDIERLSRRLVQYRRENRSLFDITCLKGGVGAATFSAVVAATAAYLIDVSPQMAWAVVINSLVLAVPAWFGSVRAELPVDPTLEGFATLQKWRQSLSKLVGAKAPGSSAVFYVREDADGPVEVRLRTSPAMPGLNNVEVAGEVIRTGTLHRTRTVFVLRLEPGSKTARRVAACPSAAEHHLTPDLQEEIVVLRNRRGRNASGLSPLKVALSLMNG